MADRNWQRIRKIFDDALRQSAKERANFVRRACGEDKTLLAEVESLLSALDGADSFLETPIVATVANVIDPEKKRLKRGTRFAHYEIIEQIGAGGMGEVYLARDKKLDRRVAVKVLNEEFAQHESNLLRFTREAKAASALNHPNILVIHEIGESDDAHFIVSEYVEGKTLREIIRESKLKLSEILDISIQITSALSAAHKAHLVHRDIKPENIVVRPDGYVKILDFGLAKLIEQKNKSFLGLEESTLKQNQTAKGVILGTVNYMSPEQAKGERVDERTDIFSLGVVIYEMLAGKTPFAANSTSETIANLLKAHPKPLTNFVSDVPDELQRIVSKMLRKNRSERFQNIKDLQIDLQNLKLESEFGAKIGNHSFTYGQNKKQILETRESAELSPNNLSKTPASIVGRSAEIAQISDLLKREDVRLLTMIGIGGTGKTTVAQAVARNVLQDFSDGVYFVEFASIRNADLVISTIAQTIGVKESGSKAILEVLKDYLRDKRMLIVLDNFEQVTEASTDIAEILSVAGNLKILITSRIPLHLPEEREFVVPPLTLPNETAQISVSELLNYEGIKLFVERAKGAKPNFALSDKNARSVARICQRLDGLPLAIELAAPRVKILSPSAILSRLENSLKPVIGMRDLPANQQIMRATVEWSYKLLDEEEKTIFRHLAVFAGGFTFEAAEAVCGFFEPQNIDKFPTKNKNQKIKSPNLGTEYLDLVTSLLDKSLLVSKDQTDGELRLRMLEVVREYALDCLEESGEEKAIRKSHATYFLAFAEKAEPKLQRVKDIKLLEELDDEIGNLRAALQWSLKNDLETGIRLAASIRLFWIMHGHLTEGRRWLEAALEKSDAAPAELRFKLLKGLAMSALLQGDYETSRKMYGIALKEGELTGDRKQIAMAKFGLGLPAYHEGNYPAARKFYEEALAINRELNYEYGITATINSLGDLARIEGNNAEARKLFEEALEIARRLDSKEAVIANLNNLGASAFAENDYQAAYSYYAESLITAQELEYKSQISYSLDGFAALALENSDLERAAQLSGAAENLREQIGFKIEPAKSRSRDGYLAKLRAALGATLFSAANEQGRELKLENAVALALSTKIGLENFPKSRSGKDKVELSASPGNQSTDVLQATTGGGNKQTFQSFSRQIRQHKTFAFFALIALFIGFGATGYYLLQTGRASSGKKSIAVLPLKPINPGVRDEIYEIAIPDSVIQKLGSMKSFVVRPLGVTRQYTNVAQDPIEAGREQQVDYVLASNYQLADGRIRITSQLFNVANGHIEETFISEKDVSDLFAMQDEIAGEIGNRLLVRFATTSSNSATKRGTNNEEAYRIYLQGMYFYDNRYKAGAVKAIEAFEQALRLDPNYARGWAGLAHAHRVVANSGRDADIQEHYQKSIEAINKALALDENLSEAHSAACENKMYYEYDFAEAERSCQRAVELDPNSALAHQVYSRFLNTRGRFGESIAETKTAIDLEPSSLFNQFLNATSLYYARRHDEAVAQFKRVIAMDENFAMAYPWLSITLSFQGKEAEAFAWFIKWMEMQKANAETIQAYQAAFQTSGWQGIMRERVKRFEKSNEAFFIGAGFSAQAGNKDQAFEFLEKSFERREMWMPYLQVDPRFDALRSDPRFDELVRRVESK